MLRSTITRCLAPIACFLILAADGAVASTVSGTPLAEPTQRLPDDFPAIPTAPAGAPNILLVMTDDVGFGAASAFGGPVPTPNLERLAAQGVSYNRFHTTSMCSPTRASLLTGRNHHAVGTGVLTDFAVGAPGYDGMIPESAATIADILQRNGYNTAFFGKHHNIPKGPFKASGPFDYWPTELGFDYFFGFIGSDTDQWHPTLFRNRTRVVDQAPQPILDQRLADDAIHWIHQQHAADPAKPFFVYLAPGSAHTPHQAPDDWLMRFRGKFSGGWEQLREDTLARQIQRGLVPTETTLPLWPEDIPHWAELPEQEKAFQQRTMEAFAAQLSFQDAQFGRIMDELSRMGLDDNTLVIFIEGDNGSDSAGSPAGALGEATEIANRRLTQQEHWQMIDAIGGPYVHSNYGTGWALAMSTPFPYFKQMASHLGGTRNGAVISWPAKISVGGIRSQYHHVIDIFPTILSVVGIDVPEQVDGILQQPVDGVDMSYSFNQPDADGQRAVQYYEMLGNRAIYSDGWLASTRPIRQPWKMGVGALAAKNLADTYQWQLFDLTTDFNQNRDLSQQRPRKLEELQAQFDEQATRFNVLPLNDRTDFGRVMLSANAYTTPRDRFVYWGKNLSLPTDVAPPITARWFEIVADVTVGDGVIAALGSSLGGWSFGIESGHPIVHHALSPLPEDQFTLSAPVVLQSGRRQTLTFEFDYDGGGVGRGGTVRIKLDGDAIAERRLERSILVQEGPSDTFDIGFDSGGVVCRELGPDNAYSGELYKLTVVVGEPGLKRSTH